MAQAFSEVIQSRAGVDIVMRYFESKPDQLLASYYCFLPVSNYYYMRGPLLSGDSRIGFVPIDNNQNP
jgi:hypothetical protein